MVLGYLFRLTPEVVSSCFHLVVPLASSTGVIYCPIELFLISFIAQLRSIRRVLIGREEKSTPFAPSLRFARWRTLMLRKLMHMETRAKKTLRIIHLAWLPSALAFRRFIDPPRPDSKPRPDRDPGPDRSAAPCNGSDGALRLAGSQQYPEGGGQPHSS